ncbi:hypothetical protein SAMN05661091_4088 [Paenibacillus uliginis N3/975]|uniref:Uncharacterized protein n=1 Tax=Paenibacillus uliginis N3/975 TaxID=1313296 RepID=A0A1X7HK50_9BACL|nr:hypothetical protein [Paenibacillus uliginis]SMF88057.1 hypothetical protein SAMN05661091_4088 [Paenibacillus uliginis N3/975]
MGTSVPNWKNEIQGGSPPSEINHYTLNPEELAAIQGKPIPPSHKKPIGFATKIKEVETNMAKVKKQDYLSLRAKGLSKEQASKKLGTTLASLESYWLTKQWGIKDEAAEEVAIFRYKEAIKGKKEKSEDTAVKKEVPVEPEIGPLPIHLEMDTIQKEEIPQIPVRLPQEQADALRMVLQVKEPDEIVLHHSQTFIITRERRLGELDPLNDMTMDDMIRAVYFGYEIKRTPEEQLLYEFEQAEAMYGAQEGLAYRTGLQIAAEILGHKVVGVNA